MSFTECRLPARCLVLVAILALGCDCSQGEDRRGESDCQASIPNDISAIEQGWVTVPPGTFVAGSPQDTPCRGKYTETEVQVTLTRSFRISPTEVTQAQWEAALCRNPMLDAIGPEYPVGYLNWYETLAYCNALSDSVGLERCYDLSSCRGVIGKGCPVEANGNCSGPEDSTYCPPDRNFCVDDMFVCFGDVLKYKNDPYACPGYRLPTNVEFNYAARAGTTAQTYNGEVTTDEKDDCRLTLDDVVDPIAWHCGNTGGERPRPVATRQPNAWGLYDMLGNMREWTESMYTGMSLEANEGKQGPLVDPVGTTEGYRRNLKGGTFLMHACYCRASDHHGRKPNKTWLTHGFRPVRTVLEEGSSP